MLFQAEQAYFTEVLKRLDALHERAPKGSVLFELATAAGSKAPHAETGWRHYHHCSSISARKTPSVKTR
jgi:hypothetical protein